MIISAPPPAGPPPGPRTSVHVYPGVDGHAQVELLTAPQTVPTYMGGTQERGRGAIQGRVLYTPMHSADKVSHISVKVKCVVLARTPVANAHAPHPAPIVDRSPGLEKVQEREVVLLQLGDTIYAPKESKDTPPEARGSVFHPATAVAGIPQATLSPDGKTAAFGFKIDLPRHDLKEGEPLPPSFVLSSCEQSLGPSAADAKLAQDKNLIERGRSLLSFHQGAPPSAPDRHHWASVKWYVKVTIGRPGVLQANDRILIPFQYLPPPPAESGLIHVRARMGAELRANTPFAELLEPPYAWRSFPVGPDKPDPAARKRGLFSAFARQKMLPSDWSISMPQAPSSFPVQGSIPFTVVSTSKLGNDGQAPLSVAFYRRLRISRRKDSQALDERLICEARIAPSPATVTLPGQATTFRWNGVLDLPPSVGPSFRTKMLDLEYYIGVAEVNPQEPPAGKPKRKKVEPPPPPDQFIHTEPVQIFCPPPRPLDGMPVETGHHVARTQPLTGVPVSAQDADASVPPPLPAKDYRPSAAPATATGAVRVPCVSAGAPTARPSAHAGGDPAHDADLPADGTGFGLDLPPSYFQAVGVRDSDDDHSSGA